MNRQPAHRHEVVNDETLIGRSDPTTNTFPDLDLTPFDASQVISRRHVQILREGGHFYVQPLSAGGTQVGKQLLNLGDRAELKGGEVLILGAKVALKFERAQQEVVEKKRARLTVYMNRQPAHQHEVVNDETLIGRSDPTTNTFPDLDLTPFDASQVISRRHVQILREGGHFYVQPLSAGGTQVGKQLLNLGDRAELKGGEVLILGAKVALKFDFI
jgi:predicted component of type VI protein secretion system